MRTLSVLPFFLCLLAAPTRADEAHWVSMILRVGQQAVFEDRSDLDRERPFLIRCIPATLRGYTITEIHADEIVFKVPRKGMTAIPLHRIQQIELARGEHIDLSSIDEKKRAGLARHFRDNQRVNIKVQITFRGVSPEYRTIIPHVLVIGDRPEDVYAEDKKSKMSYEQWTVASVQNDFLVLTGPVIHPFDTHQKKDASGGRQIVIPIAAVGAIHIHDMEAKAEK